jgi:hypothetical protein
MASIPEDGILQFHVMLLYIVCEEDILYYVANLFLSSVIKHVDGR